jgi:hypothetical protein
MKVKKQEKHTEKGRGIMKDKSRRVRRKTGRTKTGKIRIKHTTNNRERKEEKRKEEG